MLMSKIFLITLVLCVFAKRGGSRAPEDWQAKLEQGIEKKLEECSSSAENEETVTEEEEDTTTSLLRRNLHGGRKEKFDAAFTELFGDAESYCAGGSNPITDVTQAAADLGALLKQKKEERDNASGSGSGEGKKGGKKGRKGKKGKNKGQRRALGRDNASGSGSGEGKREGRKEEMISFIEQYKTETCGDVTADNQQRRLLQMTYDQFVEKFASYVSTLATPADLCDAEADQLATDFHKYNHANRGSGSGRGEEKEHGSGSGSGKGRKGRKGGFKGKKGKKGGKKRGGRNL